MAYVTGKKKAILWEILLYIIKKCSNFLNLLWPNPSTSITSTSWQHSLDGSTLVYEKNDLICLTNWLVTLTREHIAPSPLLVVPVAGGVLSAKAASFLCSFAARDAACWPVRPLFPTCGKGQTTHALVQLCSLSTKMQRLLFLYTQRSWKSLASLGRSLISKSTTTRSRTINGLNLFQTPNKRTNDDLREPIAKLSGTVFDQQSRRWNSSLFRRAKQASVFCIYCRHSPIFTFRV